MKLTVWAPRLIPGTERGRKFLGEPQPSTTLFLWPFLHPRCLFTPVVGLPASCYTSLASFSGRQFFLVCWAWCPPAMLLITLNVLFSCLSHWTMQAKSHPSSIPLYNFMDGASAALGDPFVSLREPSRTFDCGFKKIPNGACLCS